MTTLQFIGAAGTVTGSMHLLEVKGKKILLDCGLYQGKRKEAYEINKSFEFFHPSEIDIVILSHAHIDHAGNLPNLVKQGFKGNIYCTFATKDLATLMLQDSAHIQEKDVEFVNKKRKREGKNLFEPLYTQEDVVETIRMFIGVNYHHPKEILPGVEMTFYDAGHILGSAVTYLKIADGKNTIHFGFSGDLGRPDMPIIRDPEIIPDVDYLICESTYGGRFHDDFDTSEAKMVEVLKNAIKRRAKIIAPAFSVGRTQEIVFLLNQIFDKGLVERIPIYVDSPLSTNATQVFRLHPECFDFETSRFLVKEKDPFGFNKLTYITDAEDSKELNSMHGPMMIISASGMAESGRILHHLANNVQNPDNILLMTGYCAENTLGRRIIEKFPDIKIFGEEYNVTAEVVTFNSLSAHADSDELMDYINQLDSRKMKKMFLVHGDPDQQEKFRSRLHESGFNSVEIPVKGQKYTL